MNICLIKNTALYFNRWTRKSYATFLSIGKVVNIGNLLFDLHKKNFELSFFVNKEQFVFLFPEVLSEEVKYFKKEDLKALNKRIYISV